MLQVPETDDEPARPEDDATTPDETPTAALAEDGPGPEAAAEGAPPAGAEDEESAPRRLGPGEALEDAELKEQAATLLFASSDPLSLGRLGRLLQDPERERVRRLLGELAEELAGSPLPIVLREIQGGYRLFTDPEQAEIVARLRSTPKPERVSAAALETLAIVAYRQPVTKAEVEAIRGVQAGPMLRSLVDRGLVRVTGRAEQPGSPLQYGTTREFLDRFGLARVKDLPRDAELAGD